MRRLIVSLLFLLLLLAVAWSAFWWWSAGQLKQQLTRWQTVQREQGRDFRFDSAIVSGYPAHLRLRLEEPRLTGRGGWQWRVPAVSGEAAFLDLRDITATFGGTHELHPPESSGAAELQLAVGAGEGRVLLDDRGAVASGRLQLERLALAGHADGPSSVRRLDLAWGELAGEAEPPARDALLPFFLALEDWDLPGALAPPLGRRIDLLEAQGRVEGAVPLVPPEEALPAWAAEGGTAELEHMALQWGPLFLAGDAGVTLDERNRPLGAGTARIRGFERSLDALHDGGVIAEDIARLATMGLRALSQEDADGRRVIEVPLSAQDGLLYVGPLPLIPLAPLF